MTTLPSYLLDTPHLPLKEGQMLPDIINLVTATYGYVLSSSLYKNVQAYRGSDGYLKYDLLTTDNTLVTRFVNKASLVNQPVGDTLPLTIDFGSLTDGSSWIAKEIYIPPNKLLSAFSTLPDGFEYDAMNSNGDYAYKLSLLLNEYTDIAAWAASSFADYSTAKFTLVYQGLTNAAPDNLHLSSNDMSCVVFNIQAGKMQGLLCFLVTQ